MKKNIGKTDKIVRLLMGIVFIALAVFWPSTIIRIILGVTAFLMIFTSLTGYCHLYTLLGMNTCKFKKDD